MRVLQVRSWRFALVVYVYAVEIERRRFDLALAGLAFWGMDWFNEICFMFAIAGIAFAKMLPADKRLRILGIPNRLVMAVVGSVLCVFVEILLNSVGALTWEYAWWSIGAPWLIFLIGYLPFFLVSFWVFDMDSLRHKVMTVSAILGLDLASLALFGAVLGWI